MSGSHEVPICSAGVTYRKKPGTLKLFNSQLRWSQASRDKPGSGVDEVAIENDRLISLFTSKEGGAKVMIKIVARSKNIQSTENSKATGEDPQKTDENFLFTFLNQADAPRDRDRFKDEISSIIANNRSKIQDQQSASDQPSINNNIQGSSSNNPVEGIGSVEVKGNGNNKATEIDPLQDWRLKKRVLQNNPDLRQLHKALVIGGQINEFDFWQGREGLLYDEARLQSQTRGRSSQLVDPRPETTDGGEITISITPQMISEIFEMFPVVQKAYNENVPPLTEQNFWTRYFRSKLFDRNRSSARQSSDSVKDDEIFDKYLGDDDDGIEPKNINFKEVYKLLDLAATQEDHLETGNSQDWTMRAGNQKSSLPLMRRFNQHSQRLLDSSLGKMQERASHSQGIITDGSNNLDSERRRNYYDELDLDDLNLKSNPERIALNISAQESYFELNKPEEEGSGDSGEDEDQGKGMNGSDRQKMKRKRKRKRTRTVEEEIDSVRSFSKRWYEKYQDQDDVWRFESTRFEVDSYDEGDDNGKRFEFHQGEIELSNGLMIDNILTRYEQGQSITDEMVPKNLYNQIVSIHSTTNEFLRQFWQSILPPAPKTSSSSKAQIPNSSNLLPEQRALKAQRMISYLERTDDRIRSLIDNHHQNIEQSDSNNSDQNSHRIISQILESTVCAAHSAIRYYRDRVG